MKRLSLNGLLILALPVAVLFASGCATHHYARNQAEKVGTRLSQVEAKTSSDIASLNNDVSQLNERVTTADQRITATDQKATQAMSSAQQANSAASQAKQDADSKIAALTTSTTNALNFKVVDTEDIRFDLNKSTLTPQGKAELDKLIGKYKSQPRGMIEVVGFADPSGSAAHNLELSQERAASVSRYLVQHDIPLIAIHMTGLGEENPPADMRAAQPANANQKEMHTLARRAVVRLYGAGEMTGAVSSENDTETETSAKR